MTTETNQRVSLLQMEDTLDNMFNELTMLTQSLNKQKKYTFKEQRQEKMDDRELIFETQENIEKAKNNIKEILKNEIF